MAKSKHAPALFEVLRKQGESRRAVVPIPRWWKNLSQRPRTSEPAADSPEPEVEAPPPPAVKPVRPAVDDRPAGREIPVEAAPVPRLGGSPEIVRFTDGRLELSLNPVWVAVFVGVMILTLICSYELGRRAGAEPVSVAGLEAGPGLDPELDVARIREGTPDPGVLDLAGTQRGGQVPVRATVSGSPQPTSPVTPQPTPRVEPTQAPANAVRQKGLNYIVVERFHTGLPAVKTMDDARRDAEEAQQWLDRRGLPTLVEEIRNGYQLVTARGFKYPGERELCEKLQDTIIGYGRLYSQEGHDYLFHCEIRKF
ncbi:MAG: hypothetical protein JXA69_20380 [Phycisphaerae bacterium]|nr:hypothetical protein [Phycisphaerae bacterium]